MDKSQFCKDQIRIVRVHTLKKHDFETSSTNHKYRFENYNDKIRCALEWCKK